MEAPDLRAWAAAAARSACVSPVWRARRATKKQVTDQTGSSSTGASVLDLASRVYALLGSTAHQPTGPSAS
jgi:hypothetical protein